jgi:D-alanine-D-alanine ligase-like ATP-grasp enzyme
MIVLREPWRPHPLAWIHRSEAQSVAMELGSECALFEEEHLANLPSQPLLLRLSDPVMLHAVQALTRGGISYIGPGLGAMQRCYDKLEACTRAAAAGIDCPAMGAASFPVVIKPRRGSDSIGLRVQQSGPLPARYAGDQYIAQACVRGIELTVAVLHGRAGAPLHIGLPEGVPYSFWRKYLWRPRRGALADALLVQRVRETALEIAGVLGVDWAARIDFIYETRSNRLYFLECDVAPLIGVGAAFADSLTAAGMQRPEQLRLIVTRR